MRFSRGAVLAETALFVSAALVFMLGTIQIGAVGFLQLTSDAAAYYDARARVLTVASGSPEQATHQVFDQIPAPDISPTVLPASTPMVPVDYGYNSTNPTVKQNSVYARHGGASMLTPAQELVTVNVPGLAHILGQALGVTAYETESMWQECGTHFNVANTDCSQLTPPTNSQNNYFTQGENTPPYMVGRDLIQQCNDQEPFGIYTGTGVPQATSGFIPLNDARSNNLGKWTGPCVDNSGDTNVGYISAGAAEFLASSNWGDTGTGGSSSNGAGIGGPCDTSYGTAQNVFEAVAFHQRTYATLGQFFNANSELWQLELNSALWDLSAVAPNIGNSQNSMVNYYPGLPQKYGFNNPNPTGYGNGTDSGSVAIPEKIQTFESWEGFDDATHGPGSNDMYNLAVQKIYAWDYTVSAGDPPNNAQFNHPLAPEKNCT